MTTEFDTKQSALSTACRYVGVGIEALVGVTPKKEVKYSPLDSKYEYPEEVEIYTIKNKKGIDASFAVGKFRNGFDLWLITEDGMMMRV
jgi:hypothetical protein